MKKYETFQILVVSLSQEDVITASVMQDVVEDHSVFGDIFE